MSMPLGLGLALFAAALAAYGLPLGRAGADLAVFTFSPEMTMSPGEWLFTAGQWLTRGGVWILQDSAQTGDLSGTIYLGVMAASALYLVSGSVGAARRSVAWQQRVAAAVRLERPGSALPGWAAIGAVAVLAAAVTTLFSLPPALLTSSPAAVQHSQAGAELMNAGDLEGAVAEYEQAVQLEPESVEMLTGLGVAYMSAGRLLEADQTFAEVIRLNPSEPVANFGRGVIHLVTGDLVAAEEELQTALNVAPMFPAAHEVMGNLRSLLGDSEAAVHHFEEAIRADSTYGDAYTDLALARLRRGEFAMAADLARAHLQLDPNSPSAHAVLAMAQRRLGQVDQAEASLRQAESLAAQSADVQTLVFALIDLNQYDRAEAYQIQAGEGVGWLGNQALFMADLYITQGKLEQGMEAIELAASLSADPVAVSERRSEAYVEMENLSAALEELNQVVQVPPERWSVHAGLARIHLYQGEAEFAEREARYALGLAPFEAGLHTLLSLALLAQGQTDEAEAEALESIRLDPLRDLPHYALGRCHQTRGQAEQARSEYERFLELYLDRAYVRDYRAEVEQYLAGAP
jgi:tetratricopeptide (TPR) repeat protein